MLSYAGICTEFAAGHVRRCHKRGEMQSLSRRKIELQLLAEVDHADIPDEHKINWYKTVFESPELEAYWTSISARYNLPEACTAGFQNGREDATEAEGEDEDDLESEDEDTEGDDSSDWSSTDEDPRDHPLFLAPVGRVPKYCSVCHSKGHNDEEGARLHPKFDWNGWESDSSEGSVTKHKGKVYGKIMFVGLAQGRDEAVEDWLQRVEETEQDPCTAWSKINPRAEKEADTVAYEDSPYGCQCRHRVRSQPITNPPPHDLSNVGGAPSAVSVDQATGYGKNGQASSSSKAVGMVPRRSSAKSASKPQGIVKKTSALPRNKKLSAQSKLLEAATTPARATRVAENTDGGAGAYVSPPQEQGQGVKRTFEETHEGDDGEGSPTKKVKVGDGASAEGGRKMAPLKKNQKGKGPLQ